MSGTPLAVATGQSDTLTATVTALSPSTATPSGGNVTFYANGNSLGSTTLNSGVATLVTTSLPAGVDSITASYAGDGLDFQASAYTSGAPVVVSTLAGGSVGDGQPATAAVLSLPGGVAVDSAGDLFIADTSDNRVREVNAATGVITMVAGTGIAGYGGDGGQATAATLDYPRALALDGSGDLYISDASNDAVRKVDLTSGVITTVAGTGSSGSSGDGGAATAAKLDFPEGIALDSSGDLFIADSYNNKIREVNTAGVISTVAGNATAGYSGDGGAATAADSITPSAWSSTARATCTLPIATTRGSAR